MKRSDEKNENEMIWNDVTRLVGERERFEWGLRKKRYKISA